MGERRGVITFLDAILIPIIGAVVGMGFSYIMGDFTTKKGFGVPINSFISELESFSQSSLSLLNPTAGVEANDSISVFYMTEDQNATSPLIYYTQERERYYVVCQNLYYSVEWCP